MGSLLSFTSATTVIVQPKPHVCFANAFAPSGAAQDHGYVGWPGHARILRRVEDVDQAKNQAAEKRCQKGGVASIIYITCTVVPLKYGTEIPLQGDTSVLSDETHLYLPSLELVMALIRFATFKSSRVNGVLASIHFLSIVFPL